MSIYYIGVAYLARIRVTFTKTTEYALRTLGYMAVREHEVHSADALHSALKIPKKYLQRMLTDLTRSGLLKSTRGRNGGFTFTRKTKDITLAQIVHAVEKPKEESECFFGFAHCALNAPCAMHEVWVSSRGAIREALTSTCLADIAGTTTR
jgi:Rrf2 family protein